VAGPTIGDAEIEIGAEDNTDDDLARIQAKMIRSIQQSSEAAGQKMIREFSKAADISGDRMVKELQDDFKIIQHQLDELTEDQKIQLQAELESAAATAHLRYLARDRIVNLWAVVRGNAVAELQRLVKGLSGTGMLEKFKDWVINLGANLPSTIFRIGAMGTAIASIVSPIMNALSAIAPLGRDIGRLGGFVAAIPAYGLAAGVGLGTLIAVFKDLDKATSASAQAFKANLDTIVGRLGELRQTMQGNFFNEFAGPFSRLAEVVLPQLERGLARIASAMGRQWGAVADRLATAFSTNSLDVFFSNLEAGIDAATPGFADIAQALETIASKGSDTFRDMGEWISKIGGQFNNWAQGADIAGIIRRAGEALHDLWDVGVQAWRVIAGIFTAMDTGKSTGLDSLAITLGKIADVVNGAGFQDAMRTIFTGAADGASKLAAALGPIGSAFESLAPTIANLLSSLAGAGANALVGIMNAIAQPVAQDGINAAIAGIANLISNIDFNAAGAALGALGQAIGAVAPLMLNLINAILPVLAPLISGFAAFATAAMQVVTPLVELLVPLLQLPGLAAAVLGAFVAWNVISGIITAVRAAMILQQGAAIALAGAQGGLTAAMALGKAQMVGYIAQMAIMKTWGIISGIIQGIAAAFRVLGFAMAANPIGIIIVAIAALIGALIWFFTQTELGQAIIREFWNFLQEAWANISAVTITVFTAVAQFFTDVWTNISSFVTTTVQAIVDFFVNAWNGVVAFLTPVFELIANVIRIYIEIWVNIFKIFAAVLVTIWQAISDVVMTVWNAIVSFVTPIVQGIADFFTTVFTEIGNFFSDIWNAYVEIVTTAAMAIYNFVNDTINNVKAVWETVWGAISSFFTTLWNNIVSFLSPIVSGIQTTISSAVSTISGLWNAGWSAISSFFSGIWNGIVSAVTGKVAEVINTVSGIYGQIMGVLSGAGQWLWDTGVNIVQGLIGGITSMIGDVLSAIGDVVNGAIDWANSVLGIQSPSKVFEQIGKYVTEGFIEGIAGLENAARSAISMSFEPFQAALTGPTPGKYKDNTSSMGSSIYNNQRTQTIEAGAFQWSGEDPWKVSAIVRDAMAEEGSI
jgi:phage-related protein